MGRRKGSTRAPISERLARASYTDFSTPKLKGKHCLICTFACFTNGYPAVSVPGERQPKAAHREVWKLNTGDKLTSDQHVLHRCDNRKCIEFAHLFLGDNALNMADKVAKNRQLRGAAIKTAKLTSAQVCAIKLDSRANSLIAASYGVTANHVAGIKRGRCWKHLQVCD